MYDCSTNYVKGARETGCAHERAHMMAHSCLGSEARGGWARNTAPPHPQLGSHGVLGLRQLSRVTDQVSECDCPPHPVWSAPHILRMWEDARHHGIMRGSSHQ